MEQNPSWEANRFSANQETPRILWNPKVHYRIHKCPPPVPVLSQIDPVHTHTPHFLKIHLNVILPFTPGSPKWFFPLGSPHRHPVYTSTLPHTCCMVCPPHSSRFDHPKNIRWRVQIIKLLIMQFSSFPCYIVGNHLQKYKVPKLRMQKSKSVFVKQFWCSPQTVIKIEN